MFCKQKEKKNLASDLFQLIESENANGLQECWLASVKKRIEKRGNWAKSKEPLDFSGRQNVEGT